MYSVLNHAQKTTPKPIQHTNTAVHMSAFKPFMETEQKVQTNIHLVLQ